MGFRAGLSAGFRAGLRAGFSPWFSAAAATARAVGVSGDVIGDVIVCKLPVDPIGRPVVLLSEEDGGGNGKWTGCMEPVGVEGVCFGE